MLDPGSALAAAYAQAGRPVDVRAEASKALGQAPGLTATRFRKSLLQKDPAETDRILDALRKAGPPV